MVILLFSSCKSNYSGNRKTTEISRLQIKVLESGTTSFINVPKSLTSVYHKGDTVFVNLSVHLIDDVNFNTQKCVITDEIVQPYEYVFDVTNDNDTLTYRVYDYNHNLIGEVPASGLDSLIVADNR